MTTNNLTRLTRKIIERGFPELRQIYVIANYKKSDYALEWGVLRQPIRYCIVVDSMFRKAPVSVVVGGLAHELGHILDCENYSLWVDYVRQFLISLSKTLYILNERKIDMKVIRRGFGHELADFFKWTYAEKPENPERGLNLSEIEELIANT
ncbi:MAG: hypothetical protein KKE50_01370 [Nanoarchaeota archaeon]|nr:hypothetical protein [Nanoarchaeota archaeon]